jgi:hypothetical protein
MDKRIQLDIPTFWHHLRELRRRVEATLEGCPDELRGAAVMTASELVENAIKHGESVAGAAGASFSLALAEGVLTIEVANGARPSAGASLLARVERIARTPDKESLYLERLHELFTTPGESGGLGLYRVAFEGRFELQCAFQGEVVTVTARRAVP